MGTKREKWVDVARGFVIYLMVLGHCIQYATPFDYDYGNNIVFRVIYGFHMPMFMIISGYLFWYTLNRYRLLEGVLEKLKGILVPCATWGLVTYLCQIIMCGYDDISLKGYLHYTIYSNWFLWAVFYCSLYGFITKYVFRNYLIGYGVLFLINFLIPDVGNYYGAQRMLPFFLLGMLCNRYKILDKVTEKAETGVIILSGICYLITLRFQCTELLTGTFGSVCVIMTFYRLSRHFDMKILQKLGKASISIYLFTGIVFMFWIKEYFRIPESCRYLIKAFFVWGMSVGMTLIALGVNILLQMNKVTSRMLLGGRCWQQRRSYGSFESPGKT